MQSQSMRTAIVLVLLIVVMIGCLWLMQSIGSNSPESVDASSFMGLVERGRITRVVITGNEVIGERGHNDRPVKITLTEQAELIRALNARGVPYSENAPSNAGAWFSLLLNVAIIGFVIFFGLRLFRAAQGGGTGAAAMFTTHKGVRADQNTGVTFEDVAGIDEAMEEVKELLDYLKNPGKYSRCGARPPKGILLFGPPGTGKTLLAKAVAGEAGVAFFFISASSFVEMFVGVGAARVRSLLEDARKNAPCIVFVDEIDVLGRRRGGVASSGGQDEKESTLTEFLQTMDGFEVSSGVLFMAATNRPEILDGAITRKGRFDRSVEVPMPDVRGREKILAVHVRKNAVPLDVSVKLEEIAKITTYMTGADLENLVNEAAIMAVRLNREKVDFDCFSQAADKVRWGVARKTACRTAWDKHAVSVHECGHAVVAWMEPYCDKVEKVSVIPRGGMGGLTAIVPEHDRELITKEELEAHIRMALGGRAAEQMALNQITTGASQDLRTASDRAEAMVTRFGMTDVGLRVYAPQESLAYLDFSINGPALDPGTARRIDQCVNRILAESYDRALALLGGEEVRPLFDRLVRELEDKETLHTADLERILGPKRRPSA